MKKANLFIVGAPKCGTTAWRQYLSQHPAIAFCDPKEPHFFSEDFPNFRWCHDLDSYQALFEDLQSYDYRGDASVMYLYSQKAAENIARYNPDAKILIFVREYADFLYSYHLQQIYNGDQVESDFSRAWQQSSRSHEASRSPPRESSFLNYTAVAEFSNQISRVLQFFPRDQVRVLHFEDWIEQPESMYGAVLSFLDLEPGATVRFDKINAGKSHRFIWLARLTQRTPRIVLKLTEAVRRVSGRQRLGWAAWLRDKNRVSVNARDSIPCRDEILQHFAPDRLAMRAFDDITIRPTA